MKLLLCFYICVRAALALQKLDTVYEWKYIDYVWKSEEQKANYTRDNNFDVKDVFPVDVAVAKDGRVFVTTLGKNGKVPGVSIVSDKVGPGGPLLQPYPDWSFYTRRDCFALAAVYHVAIDEDEDKLYVLDAGYYVNNSSCPAQILVFDLKTNDLILQLHLFYYRAHPEQGRGIVMSLVVENTGPIPNLYVADVYNDQLYAMTPGFLISRDLQIFKPEKEETIVEIADERVDLGLNFISMALTPKDNEGRRRLYVRPLASRSLYAVDIDEVMQSITSNNIKPKAARNMLPSQASAMAMASDGTLFLGLTKDIAIACWNQFRPMNADNLEIIAQDDVQLQFASGMKVIPKTRFSSNLEEELWVLTNRYHKVVLNNLNVDDVNFRILKGSVKNLTLSTKCEKPVIEN